MLSLAQRGISADWLESAIVLLFVVGSAVRAIFAARAEKKREAARGARGGAPAGEAASEALPAEVPVLEGLERWRELLEGRVEPPPVPAEREPRPRPRVSLPAPPPADVPVEESWLAPAQDAIRFSESPSEEEIETRVDEGAAVETIAPMGISAPTLLEGDRDWRLVHARLGSWRAAVVASEVLGPPLALRHDGRQPGSLPG